MPTYFEVNFQYSKKENAGKPIVENFYTSLIQCGLSFQSGYAEAEKDSLENIIQRNQKKLDENFHLGFTEHRSHDYKQVLFDFCGFSQVRVFILNIKESDSVFFILIIPEADFVTFEKTDGAGRIIDLRDRMRIIENLAVRMWETGTMNSIQTGWEDSAFSAQFDKIVQGEQPNIEPFCIVPQNLMRNEWKCTSSKLIRRGGLLIKNDENWFPFPWMEDMSDFLSPRK